MVDDPYLSRHVQQLTTDVTTLVGAVAGLQTLVKDLVDDAREERQSAKEYRAGIREQLTAQRMEQAQLTMSVTDVQGKVAGIARTISEIDIERQQKKGAWQLATASARIAWTMFGVVGAAALGLFAWIMKFAPTLPPHQPGGHP